MSLSGKDEVWLIPKRSNLIQIIGITEIIAGDAFRDKTWNQGKQEAVATKMRQRNLTTSNSFSGQSVRTLLAAGPKFLGFIYTDSEIENSRGQTKIRLTKAGQQLTDEKLLGESLYNNLAEWEKKHVIESSPTIRRQLLKLILNNPVTHNSGDILVFPFRATVRLLLELDYLDVEELAYIVFSMKTEDEFELIRQRIINFRKLDQRDRELEIEAYKRTEAGQLTLVLAPSSNYFINFCMVTGLFKQGKKKANTHSEKICIMLKDKELSRSELAEFSDSQIYDFKENRKLWVEYYGDPDRIQPPKDYTLRIDNLPLELFYFEVTKDGERIGSEICETGQLSMQVPLFPDEDYVLTAFDKQTAKVVTEKFRTTKDQTEIKIVAAGVEKRTPPSSKIEDTEVLSQAIKEVALRGWDLAFEDKLNLIKKINGVDHKNNRMKGGRFEQLYFLLLDILLDDGKIDFLKWYGSVNELGLPSPAPGGKEGNPDIVFEVNDIAVVLELTTIRGTAGQWMSSEAASVPDHVNSYKHSNPDMKVVGVFCAPSINNRVENNFKAHTASTGVPIHCLSSDEMLDLLAQDKQIIYDKLNQ
jgi:hypothetical protein